MKTLSDTIAAIATAPGEGGIAVVRVSGGEASGVAEALLRDKQGRPLRLLPRQALWAHVKGAGGSGVVDEVLALWMPGPGSYTREDVLEVQCHGGCTAAGAVLDAVLARGVRLAEPGEFTLRAYLRGRIDLVQAEAVLDVIRAESGEALRSHQSLLEGRLSLEVARWQELLEDALIEIEARLDFSEEEVGETPQAKIEGLLERVAGEMGEKLRTYAWGRTAREGFRVALAGAPNTGKSSLLNRVAEGEYAIVSAVAGTTRDSIEVRVNVLGVPVRAVDTAGLRTGGDEVEAEGVRRARQVVGGADLVLVVCDGGRALLPEEERECLALHAGGRALAVVNKSDLGQLPVERLEGLFCKPPVVVSAKTGQGISDLLEAIRSAAWRGGGPAPEAPLTRLRHRAAVERAVSSVERALEALRGGSFPELIAGEVHRARRALRELLGWGAPEEVLEGIFSEFCIGK